MSNHLAAMCASAASTRFGRVGLGATLFAQATGQASTISSLVNSNGSASTASSALQAQLQGLSPSSLSAINGAISAYSSFTPVTNLAASIAQGNSPSPQAAVGILAISATMAMGPVAGAAVAVAGEAVTAIFDALQGPPPPPPPEWNYKGFPRLGQIQGAADGGYDPVPFGPNDPNWVAFNSSSDVINAVLFGTSAPLRPPIDGNFAFGTAALLAVCLEITQGWWWIQAALREYNSSLSGGSSDAEAWINPDDDGMQNGENAEMFYAATAGVPGSNVTPNGIINQYNSPQGNDARQVYLCHDSLYGLQVATILSLQCYGGTDPNINGQFFETIDGNLVWNGNGSAQAYESGSNAVQSTSPDFSVVFAAALAKDIELWANGLSYIDPYQLLLACTAAWNATHSSSSTATYSAYDFYASDFQLTYNGAHNGTFSANNTIAAGAIRDTVNQICFWRNPIYTVLRGWTFDIDSIEQTTFDIHPPITVNTGAITSTGTTSLFGSSLASNIALGAAVVAGSAVAGGVAYAGVTGAGVGTVLGSMWSGLISPFTWVAAGNPLPTTRRVRSK